MTAEAGLRARVLAAVRRQWPRSMGVLLWGNPASAATGPGHPDIGGVVRARPIALEIKKARGKPTPLQILRLQDLRDAGCYAWIIRSPYDALEAVYWVVKGWTRPLSSEPLDLNAWLTGSPPRVEAEPFEPAAEAAPPESVPENFVDNSETAAPGQAVFDYKLAPDMWDTPEHQEAAAKALGHESAEARRQAEAPREPALAHSGDQAGYDEHDIPSPQTMRELLALQADLRTVGDRVTLVYERVDHFMAVLVALDNKLNRLLQMVDDDPSNGEVVGVEITEEVLQQPAVAPKTRRTHKPKPEAPGQQAVPETGDIPF